MGAQKSIWHNDRKNSSIQNNLSTNGTALPAVPILQKKDDIQPGTNETESDLRIPTGKLVQRMAIYGGVEVSENNHYAIKSAGRNILYVGDGRAGPQPEAYFKKVEGTQELVVGQKVTSPPGAEVKTTEDVKVTYQKYLPASAFKETEGIDKIGPNDCGMYANALATGNEWRAEKEPGEHLKGMKAKKQYDPNEKDDQSVMTDSLEMNIGNMYRINWDNQQIVRNAPACPWHVATVIAKDNNDNITSEADAGNENLEQPEFRMYGTDNHTFYQAHHKDFEHDKDSPGYVNISGNDKGKAFVTTYEKK